MKNKETVEVNGVEIEVPVGDVNDGEDTALDTEAPEIETEEALGDPEVVEDNEQKADWKVAKAVLKKVDASCGWSIDDYYRRREINALKDRYNDKERTTELYKAIMALEG